MVNYELAKIYKLVCNKTGLTYIGSTCQKLLSQRLSGHVRNYKCWKNGKTNYVTSFKIIENNDYYMELLEAVPCSSFDELAKKERHYVESIDCVNKSIPGRTNKEYQQDNKENNKEKRKQYYENNKEKIKQYYENNKENNKENTKEKRKQYYENNKEKIKQYYENNKENIKCSRCGCEVMKKTLSIHQRTLKCQNIADILLEINELN